MPNLRRQALESRKTVSRKARARLDAGSGASSPGVSPTGSRAASRAASRTGSRVPSGAPSRHGSEDEEDGEDDLSQWFVTFASFLSVHANHDQGQQNDITVGGRWHT
jgi:hypothetical protein